MNDIIKLTYQPKGEQVIKSIIQESGWMVTYKDPSDNWVISDKTFHPTKKYSIQKFVGNYNFKKFKSPEEYEIWYKKAWLDWQKDNKAKCVRTRILCDIPKLKLKGQNNEPLQVVRHNRKDRQTI